MIKSNSKSMEFFILNQFFFFNTMIEAIHDASWTIVFLHTTDPALCGANAGKILGHPKYFLFLK